MWCWRILNWNGDDKKIALAMLKFFSKVPSVFWLFLRKMKGIVLKNVGETSEFFTA
jgi:hypothetical protein